MDELSLQSMSTSPMTAGVDRLRAPTKDSSVEEVQAVAQQLEGVFFSMLVGEMRKAMMTENMFGDGPGAENYAGLFDQMMGESMAQTGGLGIADMVMRNVQAEKESIRPEELSSHLAGLIEKRTRAALTESES